MKHDFTNPNMSETTRAEIQRLTCEQSFGARISTANRKIVGRTEGQNGGWGTGPKWRKSHPCVSTTAKALRYYEGDASRATFTVYPDMLKANDAALVLQRLGATVNFRES